MKDAEAYGPDKVEETITWAIGFLREHAVKNSGKENCHSSLVILTDSTRSISSEILGKLDPDQKINILTFSFDNTLRQYGDFEKLSCSSRGLFEVIRNVGDYQTAVLQFTEFFQQGRRFSQHADDRPMWSNVYYDQVMLIIGNRIFWNFSFHLNQN